MKRVYLSGPITGTKDAEQRFKRAEDEVRQQHDEPVSPEAELRDYARTHTYDEIMEECYKLLAQCDEILMMTGWEHSKGALLEWEYAKANAIPIAYQGIMPRMPPEQIRRDVIVDAMHTFAGYFTERYTRGAYRSARDTYNAAITVYAMGIKEGLITDEDGKIFFGKEVGDHYEAGFFNTDLVRQCGDRIRKEQKEENDLVIQRLLSRRN